MKFKIKSVTAKWENLSERKGEPFRDKNKAYIWASGESIVENLMNRYNRPYEFYKKEVLPVVLKEVLNQYPELEDDISLKERDWGWRQKCGCSMCGCSPGFIQLPGYGTITIHAEVEFYDEVAE